MVEAQPENEEEKDERGGTLWMSLGLGLFGFAVGFTTGLSVHEGISSILVSSLFSFAGGTILAFAGFSRMLRSTGKIVTSTRGMGLGLLTFAVGVILGQPTGIIFRVKGNQYLLDRTLDMQAEHNLKILKDRAAEEIMLRQLAKQIEANYSLKDRNALSALEHCPVGASTPHSGFGTSYVAPTTAFGIYDSKSSPFSLLYNDPGQLPARTSAGGEVR